MQREQLNLITALRQLNASNADPTVAESAILANIYIINHRYFQINNFLPVSGMSADRFDRMSMRNHNARAIWSALVGDAHEQVIGDGRPLCNGHTRRQNSIGSTDMDMFCPFMLKKVIDTIYRYVWYCICSTVLGGIMAFYIMGDNTRNS